MKELDPKVLEALDKLEDSYEVVEDRDLLLLREHLEGVLSPGDSRRIFSRFVTDSQFCKSAMPVFLADIEAGWRSRKGERAVSA